MTLMQKYFKAENEISEELKGIKTEEDKQAFCEKFGFDVEEMDALRKLYDEWQRTIKTADNVRNAWIKSTSGVDYSTDLNKTKTEVQGAYYRYSAGIREQALKTFERKLKPKDVTIEELEELKKDEENPEAKVLFNVCLKKYAESLQPQDINEETLGYLYSSGFQGEISNPAVSMAYKMYADGKEKDAKIEKLERTVAGQEELIRYDGEVIENLHRESRKLSSYVRDAKQSLRTIAEKMRVIRDFHLENIEAHMRQMQTKNIFKIIAQRIKRAFSKEPLLLPESTRGVRENCNEAYGDSYKIIQATGEEQADSAVYALIQGRNRKQREIYDRIRYGDSSKFAPEQVKQELENVTLPTKGRGEGFHEVR